MRKRYSALALASLLTSGCASGPMQMQQGYVADDSLAPVTACAVALGELRDQRRDSQNLGSVAGRSVQAPDMLSWMRQGLATLAAGQYGPPLRLHADLMMAYAQSQATSMVTQVVLRARYTREGQAGVEKTYRGAVSKMNWASGDGEIQSGFDAALGEILQQLARDLNGYCPATAPASAT